MSSNYLLITQVTIIAIGFAANVFAEENDASALAKKTQNPVADLISVPLQNNFNFNTGPYDNTQYVGNIQPVLPFKLNDDWNLITRTILPVIDQPRYDANSSNFGIGDLNPTFFLSPRGEGKFIWGVGPTFLLPTATQDELGAEKWGIGPAAVGLYMDGPWVAGVLVNNIWSFAGASNRADVNRFLMQPFVNYNLADGWYLTSSPIITSDWEAPERNQWTVPVGGGAGKLFKIGKLPVNTQLQAFYHADRPDQGADWSLRFQVQLLFPK